MSRLRAAPPGEIAGLEVLAVGDYQAQRRTARGGAVTPITLPKSNVLTFDLAGGSRIIARPSGGEDGRAGQGVRGGRGRGVRDEDPPGAPGGFGADVAGGARQRTRRVTTTCVARGVEHAHAGRYLGDAWGEARRGARVTR